MRTSTIRLLTAGIAGALSTAFAATDEAVKSDLARLQGEWAMAAGVADGYEVPETVRHTAKRVCQGDETTVTIGEQLVLKAKFVLDPSKTPKTIDYVVSDGPTKGRRHLGIYEFVGDTLRFCFGAPDADRPAAFESQTGDRRTFSVWRRPGAAAAKVEENQK